MRNYQNFIGGEWVAAKSGQTFTNTNPADTREAVAQYAQGGREDALAAIAAAKAAFPAWAAQTSVARGRVLSKASQLIEAKKPELAELLTREEGKTLAEATGEVQRTADIFRFFGGLSVEESAEALSVSPETVMRDWKFAKAWLLRELSGSE